MQNQIRLALFIGAAAMILAGPSMAAETKPKQREDEGVQKAIAYQRAKDRADAAQARKEARHPEHLTPAEPKRNSESGLANEQKREALKSGNEKSTDRKAPPPQR
jgi:glucan-binding YG repeat protein